MFTEQEKGEVCLLPADVTWCKLSPAQFTPGDVTLKHAFTPTGRTYRLDHLTWVIVCTENLETCHAVFC